jgi:hypothetical protein
MTECKTAETDDEKRVAKLRRDAHNLEDRRAREEWGRTIADAIAKPWEVLVFSVDQAGDLPLPSFRPTPGPIHLAVPTLVLVRLSRQGWSQNAHSHGYSD